MGNVNLCIVVTKFCSSKLFPVKDGITFLTQMTKGHLCYCYGESLAMSESLFRVNDKKSETAVQTMLIFATDI